MEHSSKHEQYTTDEINLLLLVRRLAKSQEEWTLSQESVPVEDVFLRVQKTLQTVKFARRLIKTVEVECEDTPARFKRLNESTVQLDGIEQFLSELHKSLLPRLERVEGESLLASLPLPEKRKKNEKVAVQQLSIIPPDPEELSPSILTTALPSLLPINTTETAKSTSFAHPFGPTTPTPRHTGSQQTTNTLHEELSSELERMAQQLKRNAMHFSTSLVKDKAVIEDTEQKIERNTEVLARQRVKMRSNTCLVVGIVVLVAVVFAMIVIVIRFS